MFARNSAVWRLLRCPVPEVIPAFQVVRITAVLQHLLVVIALDNTDGSPCRCNRAIFVGDRVPMSVASVIFLAVEFKEITGVVVAVVWHIECRYPKVLYLKGFRFSIYFVEPLSLLCIMGQFANPLCTSRVAYMGMCNFSPRYPADLM